MGSSWKSKKAYQEGVLVKGSAGGQAQCNDMEAPRVPRNFVAILTGPTLYLRATETKEPTELAQSLTQPDKSGGIKRPEPVCLSRAVYIGQIHFYRPLCTNMEQHEDMFVELMAVFIRPHY